MSWHGALSPSHASRSQAAPVGARPPASIAAATAAEIIASLDRFEGRREEVADLMVEGVKREVVEYSSIREPAFWADVRGHCVRNLETFTEVTRAGRLPDSEDLAFVREAGRRRATQFVPLSTVLQAFRIGHRVAWEQLVADADICGASKEAALDLTARCIGYVEVASAALADAYLSQQTQIAAETGRARRDLLEDLLAGRVASEHAGPAHLAWLGRDHAGGVVVVAAVLGPAGGAPSAGPAPSAGGDSEDGAGDARKRSLAGHLSLAADALAQRLPGNPTFTVVRHQEVVAIVPSDDAEALRPHVAAALDLGRRSSGVPIAAGIGSPCTSLTEIRASYNEARQALRHAQPGQALTLADISVFDFLLATAHPSAERIVPAAVRRLLEEDARQRGALVATLEAYLASGMNAEAAAVRLIVHRNTVHYRLAKVAELTGRNMRSFWDLVDLVAGVRILAGAAGAV